jgi:hypothetical protein
MSSKQTVLGTSIRQSPSSFISCHVDGCDFSTDTTSKLVYHYTKAHAPSLPFSVSHSAFPSGSASTLPSHRSNSPEPLHSSTHSLSSSNNRYAALASVNLDNSTMDLDNISSASVSVTRDAALDAVVQTMTSSEVTLGQQTNKSTLCKTRTMSSPSLSPAPAHVINLASDDDDDMYTDREEEQTSAPVRPHIVTSLAPITHGRQSRSRISSPIRMSPYPRTSPSASRSNSQTRSGAATPIEPSPLGMSVFNSLPPSLIMQSAASASVHMDIDGPQEELDADQIMEKVGLSILSLDILGEFPTPTIVLCNFCESSFAPSSVASHIKKHTLSLSPAHITIIVQRLLGGGGREKKVRENSSSVRVPKANGPAIQGLKIHNGFSCKHCSYCSSTEATITWHVAQEHKNVAGRQSGRYTSAYVQAYFQEHPKFFKVNPIITGLAEQDLYRLYQEQIAPTMEASTVLLPAKTVNDVPPLLRLTQWHTHFGDKLETQEKVTQLCNLVKVSTGAVGWDKKPLRTVIDTYMRRIITLAGQTDVRTKMLLHECPRYVFLFCSVLFRQVY